MTALTESRTLDRADLRKEGWEAIFDQAGDGAVSVDFPSHHEELFHALTQTSGIFPPLCDAIATALKAGRSITCSSLFVIAGVGNCKQMLDNMTALLSEHLV